MGNLELNDYSHMSQLTTCKKVIELEININ